MLFGLSIPFSIASVSVMHSVCLVYWSRCNWHAHCYSHALLPTKRLIPEHLTHGFSAVLCELSGCVGGIKPACIQYYRHCNQPNEWCDVSLCFWCWLWILVRCNICNHIEKSFEELCISRLYQCTNATSIQVQNRNLIHQKKRVRNGSLVLHPIGDTENYPWPFKKKEERVQWNEWMCDDVTQMRNKVVRYCKVF